MRRRDFLGVGLGVLSAHATPARPPNVIVMVVDDMGWTDTGCYGSHLYETPNIDRLAAEGMRFTQAYSACTVCSPSRAGILTGKYPARLHITDWIAGHSYPFAKLRPPDWTQHLPLKEITIAEVLRGRGYATASIGKWHLGTEEFYPEKQGFDMNRGGTHRGQPPSYFSPYRIETLADGPKGEFLTDRESSEALSFVERNRARPFFLYLPHHAVHTPLQGKQQVIEKYRRKIQAGMDQNNAVYAALVESVDDSVGALMAKLKALGIDRDTLFVFTSDNGGLLGSTSNRPLRAGKGSAYEGGVRVPFIVRWPAAVRAGTVCDTPVMGIDLLPTIADAAGARDLPPVDGVSIAPLLRGRSLRRSRALYWHYPHYHPGGARPYSAIRDGNLRLVEFQEDGRIELYDLETDSGETKDLSAARPNKAKHLREQLRHWRERVSAQMALSNPAYDPQREQQRPGAARPTSRL
jgi:arylsulfatase A